MTVDPRWLPGSVQSEIGPLESVIVKQPRQAFRSQASVDRQWKALNYQAPPVFETARLESRDFLAVLEDAGCQVLPLPQNDRTGMDSIYTRDAGVMCRKGIILSRMGKPAREEEPEALLEFLTARNIPVAGSIRAPGKLEGGDVVWLDPLTLAVGRGYRTNREGIDQLRAIVGECVDTVLEVPLPHYKGPEDVFHLMSILSPIDSDLLLVYSPLLPVPFRETLIDRGFRLVEVPDEEFESMGCNVLTLAPRRCLMLEGNPETARRLGTAGAHVTLYRGEEISRKGAGGPTCLTRPLIRR